MNSRTRKSLLQSYYRQRNIAVKQSREYDYKDYEYTAFGFENNVFNKEWIDNDTFIKLMIKNPNLSKHFKERLEDLNTDYIQILLQKRPEFVDYFKDKLVHLTAYELNRILSQQPSLIDYIINIENKSLSVIAIIISERPDLIYKYSDRMDELDGYLIMTILQKQPQLFDLFKNNLDKLSDNDITQLISSQPEFAYYFKENGMLNRANISYVLERQPKLFNYFKDLLYEKGGNTIHSILMGNPNYISKFSEMGLLDKLDNRHVQSIIRKLPQLKPYFE